MSNARSLLVLALRTAALDRVVAELDALRCAVTAQAGALRSRADAADRRGAYDVATALLEVADDLDRLTDPSDPDPKESAMTEPRTTDHLIDPATIPEGEQWPAHCPSCGSPNPRLHPAVQFEGEVQVWGEVQVCGNSWHSPIPERRPTPDPDAALVEAVRDAVERAGVILTERAAIEAVRGEGR